LVGLLVGGLGVEALGVVPLLIISLLIVSWVVTLVLIIYLVSAVTSIPIIATFPSSLLRKFFSQAFFDLTESLFLSFPKIL
jgi:hypothetical protein